MKVLTAPDSFKGALSSAAAAAVMATAVREVFPGATVREIPLSDGGEGFTAALVRAAGGTTVEVNVHDPLMRPVQAVMGLLDHGRTAVIEMASASGLERLQREEYNPWVTSTYGTGEMIRAALDRRCRRILIGVGGSATVDGGVGAIQALGGRFLDRYGHELPPGGGQLSRLAKIDLSSLDRRLQEVRTEVACDVSNPLTGPAGAAAVYAPQKGADSEMTRRLGEGLTLLARRLREATGTDTATMPRAGAAGGLAAGLAACLGARLRAGFEVVSEITGLEKALSGMNLVLTGEGHSDRQTLYGKAPYALAQLAASHSVPVLLFTGGLATDAAEELSRAFTAIFPVNPALISLKEAMERTEEHLRFAVVQAMRLLQTGTARKTRSKNGSTT